MNSSAPHLGIHQPTVTPAVGGGLALGSTTAEREVWDQQARKAGDDIFRRAVGALDQEDVRALTAVQFALPVLQSHSLSKIELVSAPGESPLSEPTVLSTPTLALLNDPQQLTREALWSRVRSGPALERMNAADELAACFPDERPLLARYLVDALGTLDTRLGDAEACAFVVTTLERTPMTEMDDPARVANLLFDTAVALLQRTDAPREVAPVAASALRKYAAVKEHDALSALDAFTTHKDAYIQQVALQCIRNVLLVRPAAPESTSSALRSAVPDIARTTLPRARATVDRAFQAVRDGVDEAQHVTLFTNAYVATALLGLEDDTLTDGLRALDLPALRALVLQPLEQALANWRESAARTRLQATVRRLSVPHQE